MRSWRPGTLFILIGILIGVIMASIVTGLLLDERSRADWRRTPGVVVQLVGAGAVSSGSDTSYAAVVDYTVDGVRYSHRDAWSSTSPDPVGTVVTVRYRPGEPQTAVIGEESHGVEILLTVIGGFMLAVFVGLGRLANRRPAADPERGPGGAADPWPVLDAESARSDGDLR